MNSIRRGWNYEAIDFGFMLASMMLTSRELLRFVYANCFISMPDLNFSSKIVRVSFRGIDVHAIAWNLEAKSVAGVLGAAVVLASVSKHPSACRPELPN